MSKNDKFGLYMQGISLIVVLLALNYLLAYFDITWATFPYQTVIVIAFSIIIVYTKSILTRKIRLHKRNRFVFLLIGAISSITIIQGIRDIMSGQLKIIINGVLSVGFCMIIICIMFLAMFMAYVYMELLNREISLRYHREEKEDIDE